MQRKHIKAVPLQGARNINTHLDTHANTHRGKMVSYLCSHHTKFTIRTHDWRKHPLHIYWVIDMLIQNLLCSVRMTRSSVHMNLGPNTNTCSPCLGVQRMQAFGGVLDGTGSAYLHKCCFPSWNLHFLSSWPG